MLALPADFVYRIDFYAAFSLLGVVQGLFLAVFFLGSKANQLPRNRYLGGLLLILALVTLEIFLCYSGLIVHILHFVDATEPLNFAVAPLVYFFTIALINQRPQRWYLHFLPFALYFGYSLFFFLQSSAFKYNAFRHAYHPDWAKLSNIQLFHADPLGIKDFVNELSIIHFLCYLPLIILALRQFFQQQKRKHWWVIFQSKKYGWQIGLLCLIGISYGLWLYKVLFIFRDLGDNIGAALNTFIIYYVNFFVIKNGILTAPTAPTPKYEKSTLTAAFKQRILVKLESEMNEQQRYLDPQLSLQALAEYINATPHHVSQVLNEQLQTTYYEWLASYRVAAAKKLLQSTDYQHFKLEEIGKKAGFNSRSAFYKAFKKVEEETPAAYRKQFNGEWRTENEE
ncbi:MAG: helix-turn-helix domain-containing protein [Saprospiraceae bacterium]